MPHGRRCCQAQIRSLIAPSLKFRVTAILSGILIFLNAYLLLLAIFQKKRLFEQFDNRIMVVNFLLEMIALLVFCFLQFRAQRKKTSSE